MTKQYLIKKEFSGITNYFDWYIEKFVENTEKQQLKKLYTKQFNSKKDCLETIKKFKNKFLNKDYFKNYQIIEIDV